MLKEERIEAKKDIKKLLINFTNEEDKVNSYLIRFHRVYLDGSYGTIASANDGEKQYQIHCRRFSKSFTKDGLRNEAIRTFNQFLNIEFFNRGRGFTINEIELFLNENLKNEYDNFINLLMDNIIDLFNTKLKL